MHLRKTYTLAAILMFSGLASAQNLPKFSGLFFGDYYYVLAHDPSNPLGSFTATPLQTSMQQFEYRRIYLTADYDIAQDFAARFRLESDPTASALGNGKLTTMVKDAFINWKNITDGGNVMIGLQGTPEINMAEGIFGYRSLEKTIQDLHGISSSRDLGVSYNQKFSDEFMAGLLVGNNSGNSVPGNKYKAAYLYVQYNPMKEFTILLNGQYNGAGVDLFNRTADIIINYANSMFSLGGQYFMNGINQAGGTTLKRNGFSINGWVAFMDELRLVARFDNYTPNADIKNTTFATSTQSFILAGLDWSVRKNVHLMPNFYYTAYGLSGSKADAIVRATFFITF